MCSLFWLTKSRYTKLKNKFRKILLKLMCDVNGIHSLSMLNVHQPHHVCTLHGKIAFNRKNLYVSSQNSVFYSERTQIRQYNRNINQTVLNYSYCMQSLASELESRSYEIHHLLKRKPSCTSCRFCIKYRHMTRNQKYSIISAFRASYMNSFNRLFRL